jgi:hypothetical protein
MFVFVCVTSKKQANVALYNDDTITSMSRMSKNNLSQYVKNTCSHSVEVCPSLKNEKFTSAVSVVRVGGSWKHRNWIIFGLIGRRRALHCITLLKSLEEVHSA